MLGRPNQPMRDPKMQLSGTRCCQVAMTLLVGLTVIVDTRGLFAEPSAASSKSGEPSMRANEYAADQLYRLARQTESAAANDQEMSAAIEQYRRALELGHRKARTALARSYLQGRGVGKDLGKAIDLVRTGAVEGDAEAAALLGWCYEFGLLDANDVLADGQRGALLASWLAILMREDDDRKRFMLEANWGMKAPSRRLPTRALAWYRLASVKGDVGASFKLAFYHIQFSPSVDTLSDYLDRVYARGDAPLILLLETCYCQLPGLFKDGDERIKCCLILGRALAIKAAEVHDPDGEQCLGLLYDGVDYIEGADEEKAKYWFGRELASRLQLARAGDIVNQYKVGVQLSEGRHVAIDLSTAAHWYECAANGGHPLAQKEIAECYRRGLGVAADPKKAAAWAERATEQDLSGDDEPRAGAK